MIPRYSSEAVASIWQDKHRFMYMFKIELALAEAQASKGLIPKSAWEEIKRKSVSVKISVAQVSAIEKTVKHDVIALLTHIERQMGKSARYLHYGITSSDVLDTAFALQLIEAADLILKAQEKVLAALKNIASKHKDTLTMGRSHGIHAELTTFGLKMAAIYRQMLRANDDLKQARNNIAYGQLSGPVGTFSTSSPEIEAQALKTLGLKPEPISTQVIPRDRHARLFFALATTASAIDSFATEIRHLQRTEVAEAAEGFAKAQKGSSAMPHKKNPILSENLSGLARLIRSYVAPALENINLWHERDISHSSVERVIAPDATIATEFALGRMLEVIKNLQVYPQKMQDNIKLTNGAIFAGQVMLALVNKGIAREKAYEIVQKHALASSPEKPLSQSLAGDKSISSTLSPAEMDHIFSGKSMTKQVGKILKRALTK